MSEQGWIKLHRKLREKAIWKLSTPEQKVVLVTTLLLANHSANQWEFEGKQFECQPGQFVTSLNSLAEACGKGVSVQNVRSALNRFEKYGFLTNKSTSTGRLITIVNWEKYQARKDEPNKPTTDESTDTSQSGSKEVTPNKNDMNDMNDMNEREESAPLSPNDERWIEWAWEKVKSKYPRKEGIEAAKPKFFEIMEQTPEAEKQHTLKILCGAMTLYKSDRDENNPDDVGIYKYAVGLKRWFDEESPKWIAKAEQYERQSFEAEKQEAEAAENEDSLVFDSERLEMLSAEEKEELIVCGALVMREADALVYTKKMRFDTREALVIRGVLSSW